LFHLLLNSNRNVLHLNRFYSIHVL
jgi:hypothetical protein